MTEIKILKTFCSPFIFQIIAKQLLGVFLYLISIHSVRGCKLNLTSDSPHPVGSAPLPGSPSGSWSPRWSGQTLQSVRQRCTIVRGRTLQNQQTSKQYTCMSLSTLPSNNAVCKSESYESTIFMSNLYNHVNLQVI